MSSTLPRGSPEDIQLPSAPFDGTVVIVGDVGSRARPIWLSISLQRPRGILPGVTGLVVQWMGAPYVGRTTQLVHLNDVIIPAIHYHNVPLEHERTRVNFQPKIQVTQVNYPNTATSEPDDYFYVTPVLLSQWTLPEPSDDVSPHPYPLEYLGVQCNIVVYLAKLSVYCLGGAEAARVQAVEEVAAAAQECGYMLG
ncbi:hypothetical protein C8R44DRAFT_736838 [Mycena epipterygia]|nr:hypothetical protein C8R44DRAFT_736838 [Mycena epipterygia]